MTPEEFNTLRNHNKSMISLLIQQTNWGHRQSRESQPPYGTKWKKASRLDVLQRKILWRFTDDGTGLAKWFIPSEKPNLGETFFTDIEGNQEEWITCVVKLQSD